MNLASTIDVYAKRYKVVDQHHRFVISEHDEEAEANKASSARPFSKVIVGPDPQNNPAARAAARRKLLRENPDIQGAYNALPCRSNPTRHRGM